MQPLGHLQERVMLVLWQQGGCSVHQVQEALNQDPDQAPLAYTTVLTVLRNLSKRGLLQQERVTKGRMHMFSPLISRITYLQGLLKRLQQGFFSDDRAAFQAFLTAYCQESPESDVRGD